MKRLRWARSPEEEVFRSKMDVYGGEVNRLIEELSRLPGIGARSAQRLAFYIIGMPEDRVEALASSISEAKKKITGVRKLLMSTLQGRIAKVRAEIKPSACSVSHSFQTSAESR